MALSSISPNIVLFKNTISHSLFSALIIYLLILIITEFLKFQNGPNIAKGVILGMILHILADILLRGQEVHILWPLPIGNFKIVDFYKIDGNLYRYIIPFEFLFFRLFGSSTKFIDRNDKE